MVSDTNDKNIMDRHEVTNGQVLPEICSMILSAGRRGSLVMLSGEKSWRTGFVEGKSMQG